MTEELYLLLDESIKLELNIADLYMLFYRTFAEDADFWWRLTLEEKNHAALLRSSKKHFAPIGRFPTELLSPKLQQLKDANANLDALITQYRECPPSRGAAFNTALRIERSAGEIHFQEFMEKQATSSLDRLFQQLNRGDKDHEIRIRPYMEEQAVQASECNVPSC